MMVLNIPESYAIDLSENAYCKVCISAQEARRREDY